MRIGGLLIVLLGSILAATALAPPSAAAATDQGLTITGLSDAAGHANFSAELGSRLKVKLSGTAALDPKQYLLFLDGRPIAGLDDTVFESSDHALVFRLARNSANAAAWKALLGAPTRLRIPLTVALKAIPASCAAQPASCAGGVPDIVGTAGSDRLDFQVIVPWRLAAALVVVLAVIVVVWLRARSTTLLKDNLLPQVAPAQQPYSLGRWQMAFWFTLIFAAFVFIYVLLGDYHTITAQALWLMGISAVSGVAAMAVDIVKDSPADAANRGLEALGLHTYDDVVRVSQEIAHREAELKKSPPTATAQKLGLEIRDRQLLLTAYRKAIEPFVSEGWFRDLTTDLNGATLHRVQTLIWTLALGVVFAIGVYTDLAMPQFDGTLLLLLGISNAGYIGFKYPEPQQ